MVWRLEQGVVSSLYGVNCNFCAACVPRPVLPQLKDICRDGQGKPPPPNHGFQRRPHLTRHTSHQSVAHNMSPITSLATLNTTPPIAFTQRKIHKRMWDTNEPTWHQF